MSIPFADPRIMAREAILVGTQCLIQKALNETYGNPRDCEENDPKKTRRMFKEQRRQMAQKMGWSKKKVKRLFANNANITIQDLAEILHVFGYDLIVTQKKRK